MFVMDEDKYLKEVYAKEIKIGDYLPHIAKLYVDGEPKKLPDPGYPFYRLKIKNWNTIIGIFKSRGFTWKKISKICGFSVQVLSNLKNGRMIRRRNMECLLNLFPELDDYIEGVSIKNEHIPRETNEDICQLIGYFIGDGSISNGYIAFHDNNLEVLYFYNNLIRKIFGIEGIIRSSWNKSHYILYLLSRRIRKFFQELNVGVGDKKNIPKFFHTADNKCIKGLIRGLFDAEGSLNDRSIHFTNSSEDLVKVLRLLLLRLGIFSSLYRINRSGRYGGYYYSLEICGDDVLKYYKEIGFSHPKKKAKLEEIVRKGRLRFSTIRVYPVAWFKKLGLPTTLSSALRDKNKKFITYQHALKIISNAAKRYEFREDILKLKDIIDRFVFLKVIEVKRVKKEEVMYDFYVPPNHNFIANGILVHNCIINAARNGASVLGGTLYLYGIDPKTGKTIYSEPCDRCKRAIINAGIVRVVTVDEDGSIIEFDVKKWIELDTKKYLKRYRLAKEGKLKL
jgi:intein/homing endonuclease